MPAPADLSRSGVKVADGKGKQRANPVVEAMEKFARAGGGEGEKEDQHGNPKADASPSLIQMGCGLPALSKKLLEKVETDEYVDFTELPPAKGKGRSMSQAFDGQIVVVQAADLVQTRRLIPDLATWVQCFGLYTAAVARRKPEKLADMMAYMAIIAKASQKYKWPSWIIYDQNFRMDVAGNSTQCWAKVDPSLYAQCFTGQALSTENWCSQCQGLDHSSGRCPYKPQAQQKRTWGAAFGQSPSRVPPATSSGSGTTCFKFNRYNGDCRYGKQCRFEHVCSGCGGPHPVQKCKAGGKATEK